MVSADAGIWLAHFRNEPSVEPLRRLLEEEQVSVHPFVLIQLRLRLRGPELKRILADMEHLVACPVDPPEVVSAFIEQHDLASFQVDLVGAHLLASATRHEDQLWAAERELREAAVQLKIAFSPSERRAGG